MAHPFAAVPVGVGLLVSSAFAADDKPPHPPPAPKVQAPRPAAPARAAQKQAQQPDNHPGEQQLNRLLRMTPAEREKALQGLPAARREKLLNGLNAAEKWSNSEKVRERYEKLASLPPQRQNQVRRSLKQFQDLPEDRRGQITQELRRMAPLPDDERRAYMNSEEFRNRYSANEQQIMSNLSLVVEPETSPRD